MQFTYRSEFYAKIGGMAVSLIIMAGIVLVFFRDAALYASFVVVAIAFVALGIWLTVGYPIEPRTKPESILRVNRVLADPWEKEQAPRKSRIVPIEPPDPELVEILEQGAKLEAWISGRNADAQVLRPPEGS